MPAAKVVIELTSLVPGGPKNTLVIKVSGKSWILAAHREKRDKGYREEILDDFLEELGNPTEEVKQFFESMKEGGVKEGVFPIEEGDFFEQGGA